MCMNCTPIVRQYVLRSRATICRSVICCGPSIVSVENVRSMSASAEVIERRIELRQFRPRQAQRIDLRDQVPADAIRADELIEAVLQDRDVHLFGGGMAVAVGGDQTRGAEQAWRAKARTQAELLVATPFSPVAVAVR